MLCENCGKNEAAIHLTQIQNNEMTTRHLCEVCAEAMGLSVDEVLMAQEAVYARSARSLDRVIGDDLALGDQLGAVDPRLDHADDRLAVASALEELDEPEVVLLRRYFVEEQSQSTIAADLGISQMQVSRLLANVLGRMRSNVMA